MKLPILYLFRTGVELEGREWKEVFSHLINNKW